MTNEALSQFAAWARELLGERSAPGAEPISGAELHRALSELIALRALRDAVATDYNRAAALHDKLDKRLAVANTDALVTAAILCRALNHRLGEVEIAIDEHERLVNLYISQQPTDPIAELQAALDASIRTLPDENIYLPQQPNFKS